MPNEPTFTGHIFPNNLADQSSLRIVKVHLQKPQQSLGEETSFFNLASIEQSILMIVSNI